MSRKIVFTSGKGGVGKTTIIASLGLTLAKSGYRVLLIDGDIGLNNLDVIASVEDLIVFDLIDVLNGNCRLNQALVESPLSTNLFLLPCTHSLSNINVSNQNLQEAISGVDGLFDYIFIDCPAGIELSFHRAVSIAEEAVIIVNPSISSVRDADKVIGLLKSYKLSNISLIVNRIRGDLVLANEMYSANEIAIALKIPLIGVIPEDDILLKGLTDTPSESQKALKFIVKNLNGKSEKTYDYLKKYTGFWGSIRKGLKKVL
jgi:septum site-determining protein MinD